MDISALVMHSGPVAKGVLLILMAFSIGCWTIIIMKWRLFRKAEADSAKFLAAFKESESLFLAHEASRRFRHSPLASMFGEAYRKLTPFLKENPGIESLRGDSHLADFFEGMNRTLRQASIRELSQLEKHLIFLATTGAVTPFIGLFGTVWGIIGAFHGIGAAGSANIAAVAPGISEALVATAAGLGAAVPAVIAYNYFLNHIKGMSTNMEFFSLEFLNLLERLIYQRK
ncbi:MAG: MotA/TolQ/ExbB proton channel family protein [bacterium]